MSKHITFRDATPEEASALSLLNARAYANRDESPYPETGDDYITSLIEERMTDIEGSWTHVAVDGEAVIGFVLTYPRPMDEESADVTPDTSQLSFIAVDPNYQRQGIASALINRAVEQAQKAGMRWMSLWTDEKNNEGARSLYEKKGFALTGKRRDAQEGRFADQVVYQMDL